MGRLYSSRSGTWPLSFVRRSEGNLKLVRPVGLGYIYLHKFMMPIHGENVSQSHWHQPVGHVLRAEIDGVSAALFGVELASVDFDDGNSWVYWPGSSDRLMGGDQIR